MPEFFKRKPKSHDQPAAPYHTPEQRGLVPQSVCVDTAAHLLDDETQQFACELWFFVNDPYAVTLKIEGVKWTIGLDLLVQWCFEPAGFAGADAQMQPWVNDDASAGLMVTLTSEESTKSFIFPAHKTQEFIDKVEEALRLNHLATVQQKSALAGKELEEFDFSS